MGEPPGSDEFRKAVADVEPLDPPRRRAPKKPPAAPVPAQTRRDERAVLEESIVGHWVVQDELDLHGMNRVEAAAATGDFLRRCMSRGARCVRIVHGKGLGSHLREPVLKHVLRKILPRRDEVLAFCQAPAAQGGSGAMLVLLRARR